MGTLMRTGDVEATIDATPGAGVGGRRRRHARSASGATSADGSWLDGATTAAVGARFAGGTGSGGRGGRDATRSSSPTPGREIAGAPSRPALYPDSTMWRIRSSPAAYGTRIVQTFEVVKLDP